MNQPLFIAFYKRLIMRLTNIKITIQQEITALTPGSMHSVTAFLAMQCTSKFGDTELKTHNGKSISMKSQHLSVKNLCHSSTYMTD